VDMRQDFLFLRKFSLLPSVIFFTSIYSILPHKELRFIVYVIPVFNALSAFGASKLDKSKIRFLKWSVYIVLGITLVISVFGFLLVSSYNYPGGTAFRALHSIEDPSSPVNVHIGVFPAMTGVSRFGELNPNWRYNKTETLTPAEINRGSFTHMITSNSTFYEDTKHWEILKAVHGYQGIKMGIPPAIKTVPQVYILKRKSG